MKPCDNKQQIYQENLKFGGHYQQQDQDVIDSIQVVQKEPVLYL